MLAPMRVVFLSNSPVPYQRELLEAIEREGQLEVHPFFLGSRDPGRAWPDPRAIPRTRILPALAVPGAPPELALHWSLPSELRRIHADIAIVCGYSQAAFQLGMATLVGSRCPFVLWSELPRIGVGAAPVRLVRRALIAPVEFSRGVLAIGQRAAEAWRQILRPRIPVANFPYVCDVERYLALPRRPRGARPFTLLFVGQLIERKGVDLLLHAFIAACARRSDLQLRLAGEGPLRARLEAMVPPGLRTRIEFCGFVPWEALPALYADADALVLPSRHDGWGLVVNEALASGIPVIASEAVGAGLDLLRDGAAGLRVPVGDCAALAEALVRIPETAEQMGRAARALAAKLSPADAARRLFTLLSAARRGELRDALGAVW